MSKSKFYIGILIGLMTVLALTGCSLTGLNFTNAKPPATAIQTVVANPIPINPGYSPIPIAGDSITSSGPDIANIIAAVRPSVVAINTVSSGQSIFGGSFTQQGAGSGWIIDSSGLIVTNNHVVQDATNISVTLEDGRNFSADTVRSDVTSDLAVIKISAPSLPAALKVGDSSKLRVGNSVMAIGNSLGEGISATMGIVSALGVSVDSSEGETLYDLIQTDAAINPGNSGGPLVNTAGEVVGINSIKVSQVGVEGMGYAISSQTALPIINDLITNGYVSRPWLGVGLYTVDQTAIRQLKLSVNKGVLITQVASGSPADAAGIKQYDVITGIDGKDVATVNDLMKIIRSDKVGQTVQVTYWRTTSQNTVSVTLVKAPTG